MRGEFVDVGGRRLYYYAAGTRGGGDPIVLLHGFPTNGQLWSTLVPLLPKGHRVVVVDLLGYGRSDRPFGADLSIGGHAQRTLALMNVLGIRRATIVGHHLGGAVCIALAHRWPERVGHLGLLHSLGGDVTFTGTFAVMRAFFPLSRIAPPVVLRRFARRELQRWYVDPVRAQLSIDRFLRALGGTGKLPGLLQHLLGLTPAEMRTVDAVISQLDLPVAIVAAPRDPAVPHWVADRLGATIPNATLDLVEHVRHFSPEEAPERVAGVIERLVAR